MAKQDSETKKTIHRHQKLFKRVRHFQRNRRQRYGKGKDGVREAFQSCDLTATPAEMRFRWDKVSAGAFVKHGAIVPQHPLQLAMEFLPPTRLPTEPPRHWLGNCPERWLPSGPYP
jgi:hypothetical protein